MDAKYVTAHDNILKAREALRRGDKKSAHELGEQAALLIPEMEDAWLVLAASDSDPQEALAYARKALELKPDSARAQRAVEWATGLAKQAPAEKAAATVVEEKRRSELIPAEVKIQKEAVTAFPRVIPQRVEPQPQPESKPKKRAWIYAAAAGLLVCVVLAIAAWSAFSSPVFASFLNKAPAPTQENLWASVNVPKPSITAINVSVFAVPEVASTATPVPAQASPTTAPTEVPALAVADTPTILPTEALTSTPEITETPGVMAMEIVADTPTSAYVQPNPDAPKPSVASNGGTRWIDVDLTNQRVYAYEGETVVNSFLVSTGTWLTPTVTGQYKIYVKYEKANMHGPGYFLPDVPYVMYFYKGYGLHGTYWHHNFGTPMSHGCVNLETGNAGWLFSWASIGTVVNVHY
jgi:lipoprotein-anchoring transpeptidase ErfK/SrfK/nucleotide-binding universal stress UspA family protein